MLLRKSTRTLPSLLRTFQDSVTKQKSANQEIISVLLVASRFLIVSLAAVTITLSRKLTRLEEYVLGDCTRVLLMIEINPRKSHAF